MKFKCDPKDLNKALEIASKALSEKTKIAGYDGVKISTEGKYVIVTAASGEMYIEKKIQANILVDGNVFIKPTEIKNLLSQLKDYECVEIENIGNELFIFFGLSPGSYAVIMGLAESIPYINFET